MTTRIKFQAAFDGMVEYLAAYVPELLDEGYSPAKMREFLTNRSEDARWREVGVDLTALSYEDMLDVIDEVLRKSGVV